jgi:ribosomal protein L11 methyltransferase
MAHYEIEFALTPARAEAAETALFAAGAMAVSFVDGADDAVLEPELGEVRLWPNTVLRALFDSKPQAAAAAAALTALLPLAPGVVKMREIEDRAWERVWLADWKPLQFGHLWVLPQSFPPPPDVDAIILRLDPGLAFGTGTHPSTALCLRSLAALDLVERSVIDYGCGSGILGVAALKLGAKHCIAVDIDPQALLATQSNATVNAVDSRIMVQGAEAPLPAADCLVANILAGPLIDLAPRLAAAVKPGGDLLLSGILRNQANGVTATYATWFDMVAEIDYEDWCCLRAVRK